MMREQTDSRVEKAPVSAAVSFLSRLFQRSQAPVFITSLANERAASSRIPPRWIVTRESGDVDYFLDKWDQAERGLYFCVATLRPGITRRAKENLSELIGLHCDLDLKGIAAPRSEVERVLRALPCRPNVTVFSGHGLHVYWSLEQVLPATSENIAHIERLLRKLAEVLAGDPAVCECARLMRLPGSHNTKGGEWTPVRVIERRSGHYTIERIEHWLASAKPLLPRIERKSKHKVESSDPFARMGAEQVVVAPIDVETRLAEMTHHAPDETSIHNTQLSVTAALLARGYGVDEVVRRVLAATAKAAGREGNGWNWHAEKNAVHEMCKSWLKKHPRRVFVEPVASSHRIEGV